MRAAVPIGWLVAALSSGEAAAVDQPSPTPPPAAVGDQRLVFSTNGSRLTGGSGGGGGSAAWLGSVGPGVVIGAGADYETIANAHWTLGTFTASVPLGLRTHLYVDGHEGAGDIGVHAFHYSVTLGGALVALTSALSVQLEERYIDVDTAHGNLPKVGLSYRVTPQLMASASYAYSLGGNLGTRLPSARIDYTGSGFSALAGIAVGPVAPVVVGNVVTAGKQLHEGFIGVGKSLQRTDWLLLGDYQDVEGTKRPIVSLTCTVHLQGQR